MQTADWTKDFWRRGETDSEHDERVDAAKKEAGELFAKATPEQHREYRSRVSYANLVYANTPHGGWLKQQALQKFREATKEASDLCERTCISLMQTGEVSEALSLEWDALKKIEAVRHIMQAAE